ncbi:MAG: aldehyde dehydrogenase family protein [Puniceicoccales bacterium]|jgi:acetaldehyde dehydrogenase/alcohol dehydrogenase|nr:aldehyde dehydrogenase family protein [Puniceicoccales bacterium]
MDDLDTLIGKAKEAQKVYAIFPQEKVDAIFKSAAMTADEAREELARMAVDETGMGIVKDKIFKNHFAAHFIYEKYAAAKTCGIISEDKPNRIKVIVDPIGLIAGVIPTTNPTATAIFKALLVLKTRNGIVVSPHPRAKKCTAAAVKIVADAAIKAGAPKNLLACLDEPTLEATTALMHHPSIDLILATGGGGMVKAAYASGKPALGVGAGNTPAIIDENANVSAAVEAVLASKTFDNGVICASEQSIVAVKSVYDGVRKELAKQGAYILNKEESATLGKIIINEKGLNPAIVGQSAQKIGELAGLRIPATARVLVSEEKVYDASNPYAREKLSLILSLYGAPNFEQAVEIGLQLISIGGLGHTSVLHTDANDQRRIDYFANKMPTGRLLINLPASQGAIGFSNDSLTPSLTLGCGSWGGNASSENIGIKHLLNYKTIVGKRG